MKKLICCLLLLSSSISFAMGQKTTSALTHEERLAAFYALNELKNGYCMFMYNEKKSKKLHKNDNDNSWSFENTLEDNGEGIQYASLLAKIYNISKEPHELLSVNFTTNKKRELLELNYTLNDLQSFDFAAFLKNYNVLCFGINDVEQPSQKVQNNSQNNSNNSCEIF